VLSAVDNAVLEQPFRIWLAAATDRPVRSQVEMDEENAVTGAVDVGDHEASGSRRLILAAARGHLARETAAKLPVDGTVEVISLRKAATDFRFANELGRNGVGWLGPRSPWAARRPLERHDQLGPVSALGRAE
jgi:hypothetical protein